MVEKGKRGACGCEAFAENAGANGAPRDWRRRLVTPRSQPESSAIKGKTGGELCNAPRKIANTSRRAAVCGRRSLPIRKKIIGHNMPAIRFGFGGARVHRSRWVFALPDQPSRHHGGSILLKPLVKQCADFLAQIRGVAQPR